MKTIVIFLLSLQAVLTRRALKINECGTTRGCWMIPTGCNTHPFEGDCEAIITWRHTGRSLTMEMEVLGERGAAPNANGEWIAWGIDDDGAMGNDTVIECNFPRKGDSYVQLSHNHKQGNIRMKKASDMLLKDSWSERADGRMLCGTEWMIDMTMLEAADKKIIHRIGAGKYHLMFAKGALDAQSNKKPHGFGAKSKNLPWITTDEVRFCARCKDSSVKVAAFHHG